MPQARKIFILYTDAGGGHRATARALQAILRRQTPHEVTLINPYRELIADIDLFPRFTGYSDEEVYNRFVLGRNWPAALCLAYYGLTLLNVKLGTRRSARRFLTHWRRERPDLVISVMPLANQGIYRSVQAYGGKSPVPFLVIITDFQEEMRHTWFPRQRDYYIACGSERAFRQALAKPHPPELTFRTSGLPVHPAFYDPPPADRAAARAGLGLRPDLPTGCMLYGSAGSPRMEALARALGRVERELQMIFICGRNRALAEALARLNLPYPHLILGYTTEVPRYLALSDFLVCKPGPGTISEALASGLALLVDRGKVLPQERYNLSLVRENHLGLCFKSPEDFRRAVRELLEAGPGAGNVSAGPREPENRAIFELPGIIKRILDETGSGRTLRS